VLKRGKLLILILLAIFVVSGFIMKSLLVEKPKVVVVLRTLDREYWQTIKAGTEKGFRDFGVDGEVVVAHHETDEEHIKLLEKVQKEKPDIVIVTPDNSSKLIPKLEEFISNGIPVILLSANLELEGKTSYVGTDNVELGKKAGAFLATQLQPGDEVAIIGGTVVYDVFNDRARGANMMLKNAGVNVVAEEREVPEDTKAIHKVMEKILREHPDIKGIVATHDTLALEVIKALEDKGLNIPVTGADGTTNLIELIEAEKIPGTVAQNPYDMAYLSVETALKVTKGEKVEKFIDAGVDIIIKGNAEERLDFLNGILK
jgi:ribose transport system substrate-binding protein